MSGTIRILIVDDHEVVRLGLRVMFAETEIEIAGEAANGEDAIRMARQLRPDIVLLAIRMRGSDGLSALGRLRREMPALPVLMFSAHDNPTWLARAAELKAGGYLHKSCNRDTLLRGIRQVAAGERIWTAEETRRVSDSLAAPIPSDGEVPLTRRECEVLRHLSTGMSNREIAATLHISYETVKEHVQHILRKLGVSDRTQAAVWAVRRGIV
ncbi:MAG: response regulator transcription factor [Planctomycetia bacterium]|nr:response regulator transcription factor [Planctomycetia bacterium]